MLLTGNTKVEIAGISNLGDLGGLALPDYRFLHSSLAFGLDSEWGTGHVTVGKFDVNQINTGFLRGVGNLAVVIFTVFTVDINLKEF